MEDIYQPDPHLVVEPSYYSGGIPVFEPTIEQFKDFYKFNKAINKYGMKSGIVKIIPPKSWTKNLPANYTHENLESIKIKNPIIQHINGSGAGVFSQQNIERPRSYNIFQWKELSEKPNYQPPAPKGKPRVAPSSTDSQRSTRDGGVIHKNGKAFTKASTKMATNEAYNIDTSQFSEERCEQLEKTYWKSLTYAEPMYGADLMGSLFSDSVKSWNVAQLPNILDLMDTKLPGVNDAYLYAGLWKATFAWHLEDQDLYSINYLHFGAPKQWYSIPQEESGKFFELMKDTFPEEHRLCLEFLRHKTFLVSPQFLAKHGIKCNRIVHNEGEFIITYPFGYHAGFNYGYNLAESVNFALDDWFQFGEKTKKCECISDSVGINVQQLYCKYKGIPYEYQEDSESEDNDISSEGASSIIASSTKKTNMHKKPTKPQYETLTVREPVYECCLCPNGLPKKLTKSTQFELLNTDLTNKGGSKTYKVHRVCAQMFPSQLTIDALNNTVSGMELISSAQKNLKCTVCDNHSIKSKKSSHGACFQCSYSKCSRAFHGTCGLGGGVLYDMSASSAFCKFHRTKKAKTMDFLKLSTIPINSLIQFMVSIPSDHTTQSKEIYCGYVISNNVGENTIEVVSYPNLKDNMEVQYNDIVIGSNDEIDNSYFWNLKKARISKPRAKKLETLLVDDDKVTGIKSNPRLSLSKVDWFITEVFTPTETAPKDVLQEPSSLFWYNLPKCSTDQVARYTDDATSTLPNDSNYKKYLHRKKSKKPIFIEANSKRGSDGQEIYQDHKNKKKSIPSISHNFQMPIYIPPNSNYTPQQPYFMPHVPYTQRPVPPEQQIRYNSSPAPYQGTFFHNPGVNAPVPLARHHHP